MTTQQEILDLILENEGIIQSNLPKILSGTPGNINKAIMRLKKKNMIKREVYKTTWKLYSVKIVQLDNMPKYNYRKKEVI